MKIITVSAIWLIMGSLFIVMLGGFLAWHFWQVAVKAMVEAESEH